MDGFYSYRALGQQSSELLESKLKDDRSQLDKTGSGSKSNASFEKDLKHESCEWKCEDHGPTGAHKETTRDHAIPQRGFDRVSVVVHVEFRTNTILDVRLNCCNILRHGIG